MIIGKEIVKTFYAGSKEIPVLKGISMNINKGEFVSIMGQSGAGKSTLLYQLSLLDNPTSGTITIDDQETSTLRSGQRMKIRLNDFGFVFQEYAILPELTAVENVMVPMIMRGQGTAEARQQASDLLSNLGLKNQLNNIPAKLSGGEQQRVSIARAVVHKPKILFADEPTANLDSVTSAKIMDVFDDLHQAGQTIVMVTHELEYAKRADRIIQLKDGLIISRG